MSEFNTSLIHQILTAGAFFTTYEATRSFLQRYASSSRGLQDREDGRTTPTLIPAGLPQPLINATASSIGELVSCLILTPAEVLKQNAQMINTTTTSSSSTPINNSPSLLSRLRNSSSIRTLHQFRHQPTQLWRGYTALAARNLPFTAIQFPLFEHLKTTLIPSSHHQPSSDPHPVKTATLTALSGGLAGSLAAIITTPIDVIKTRIMLSAADNRHGTAWAMGKSILRDEGVKTLFRGGLLRAVWTALASGLYLGAYETGRRFFEGRRRRRRRRGRRREDDEGDGVV